MAISARGLGVRCFIVLAVLLAAGLERATASAASAPSYAARDLGLISAPLSDALKADPTCAAAGLVAGSVAGLNDAGVSTGNVPAASGASNAATISASGITALKSGKYGGRGDAINASGVVAGYIFNTALASPCGFSLDASPVEWVKGALKKLPLPKGDDTGLAFGIDAAGDIVGHTGTKASPAVFHGVLWKNGKIARVDAPACPDGSANSNFVAINDAGQIAGSWCGQAAMWSKDGTLTQLPSLPGGASTFALSIGADGAIVGATIVNANGTQITQPTRWVKGKASALPMPKGATNGIATQTNGAGVVIGRIDGGATVWIGGKVYLLADHLTGPFKGAALNPGGINAGGQIAVAAKKGAELHALLLTPST